MTWKFSTVELWLLGVSIQLRWWRHWSYWFTLQAPNISHGPEEEEHDLEKCLGRGHVSRRVFCVEIYRRIKIQVAMACQEILTIFSQKLWQFRPKFDGPTKRWGTQWTDGFLHASPKDPLRLAKKRRYNKHEGPDIQEGTALFWGMPSHFSYYTTKNNKQNIPTTYIYISIYTFILYIYTLYTIYIRSVTIQFLPNTQIYGVWNLATGD